MPIPSYEQLMLPLLKIISDGGIYGYKYCEGKLSEFFDLSTDEINETLKSGTRVIYDRLNWANTYLRNAGLTESISRGKFKITETGKTVLSEKPSELNYKYLLKFESFVDYLERAKNSRKNKKFFDRNSSKNTDIKEKSPLEKIEESYAEINSELENEILKYLKKVDFYRFEIIVLDLLIKMGYGGSREDAKQATKKSNDEGIDGIINEDRLGLDRIYIQAKRWKDNSVGRPEVQSFAGALMGNGLKKGIFITTSNFSKAAKGYVASLKDIKIILIDGYLLAKYMIEFNVGVSAETTYEIKRIDTDYFSED